MKRFSWPILLAVSLGLTGCATRYVPGKPLTGDPYIDGENAIQYGPAKDKVLWQYRTAAVAMRRGQFAEAKRLLEDALTRIANTLGKDPSARKSRSYFSPEAKKTFIGEPYERVMAYYYRGILYWMDGEPDNARACFRSAALEDSDTVDKKYSSDYVLLDYLDGVASLKLNGDGSDALKRAEAEAKISQPPAYNPKANVLVFAEFGEDQHIGLGLVGWWLRDFGFGFSAFQRVRTIAIQLQTRHAVEVIEQHIVAGILFIDRIAVLQCRAPETSPGVIRLPVHPVEDAAIVIGHHPLVGFADKRLLRLRRKVAAGLSRAGIFPKDIADPSDGIVQQLLGLRELATAHCDHRRPVFPQDLIFGRAVLDGILAVNVWVTGQWLARNIASRLAPG